MGSYYLDDKTVHYQWDSRIAPRVVIDSGETVTLDCRDAADGHYGPHRSAEDMAAPRVSRGHPLTGPVYVRGAEPGDSLAIEILAFEHKGWGWTRCSDRGGLLPGEFGTLLKLWELQDGYTEFKPGIRIPLEPFCGIMGVAPAGDEPLATMPPRSAGGNMDIRHLVAGSTLFLPVYVPGGLFSAGDCHGAQGDGEVCITGIEAPMAVTLRISLRKGYTIPGPQFVTPSPLTKTDTRGYFATTGIEPDLLEATRQAIRHMVEHLVQERGLTREEAYLLCSVAVDLKVSEVVDAPNWIVSAYLPLSIFVG
ncbi:MAG: Acetamidase/formamidase [Firmicutes bacterium]|nr:Acetamidase/formamidase [Bacillota bacterium]